MIPYQRCQGTKGAKGQKMPRLPGFERCQCLEGAKGAWVKSSEGLLGDRVYSRTHFRTSLTPEEGPSCLSLFLVEIQPLIVQNQLRPQRSSMKSID